MNFSVSKRTLISSQDTSLEEKEKCYLVDESQTKFVRQVIQKKKLGKNLTKSMNIAAVNNEIYTLYIKSMIQRLH